MESRRRNEKVQYQSRVRLFKRYLTFMLAAVVLLTSIPLNVAWADELPYFEQPGDDEIILDDVVEEGDLSDIDLDITHTVSKKGDKAVITVFAAPSESGRENGVTKITKVEIHQNGKLKKGKRSDGKWEFTVRENGVYSFVIYYNSNDGEDIIVASPSEIEKVEPPTEAKPQPPEVNAGGVGGGGVVKPEGNPDQDITTSETDEGTVEDGNTEEDKNNGETIEGDSNQNTSNEPEQNPSDNSGTDEGKGDTTENDGGTDSSGQASNSDNSANGGNIDSSTDEENSNSSSSSDNNSDTSSDNNNDSTSSDNSSAGSTDNGSSDSSGDSDSSSSDSGGSDSTSGNDSSSSDSGSADTSDSSDSGSSDNDGSDEDSGSSGTSIALNVIDFIFPVIEAQASDFTVKKAVIVEYEITNLFPEGDPEDVDVDIFDEPTEKGAMITLLAEPSEIGLEKGVRKITDISLTDFEPEGDSEIFDSEEIHIATNSEAEEEVIEEKEEIKEASHSEATYNTPKSSSAKHAEYQASESDEDMYRFFVNANGTYTFSIRYGRATDVDFEDSTELIETQFSMTYGLDSITPQEIQFLGVEDVVIEIGQAFDLMEGVQAVRGYEKSLLDVTVESDDTFTLDKVGDYKIIYAAWEDQSNPVGYYERSVSVRTSNIEINETNFPDANFRELIRMYDLDGNGFLSSGEISEVKSIEVKAYPSDGGYVEYNSVKGIEYFIALESLTINNTKISELDLSSNILLEKLDMGYTYLSHDLDLSKLSNLKELMAFNIRTATGALDLSNNLMLEKLTWGDPLTTSVDVSKNQMLEKLSLYGGLITDLNTKSNTNLKEVELDCAKLRELDLSNASQLTNLNCSGMVEESFIPGLFPYEKYELRSLKLNMDAPLHILCCNDTKLEQLQINPEYLMEFDASNCELKNLIMTPKSAGGLPLMCFDIGGNRLPYLDLEKVSAIYDYRTEKPQNVLGYYTKDSTSGVWYFDMKQLVGEKRTDRIEMVNTKEILSYDSKNGILTMESIPEDGTVSYKYDMKCSTDFAGPLNVDVTLRSVEVSADDVIYITIAQAQDESYIKSILDARGTYEGESGESKDIHTEDFRYYFNKEGEIIKSVDITAVMDNGWETPIMATTEVAILPSIEGNNIILYEGETYSQDKLHITINTEEFKANTLIVDDAHVNTNQAGTYQIKVTQEHISGISINKYLYVQVVGKTKFAPIPDIHTRKGSQITSEQIMAGVSATYEKPMDIPDQPWEDSDKINGGHAAIATAVEVHSYDVVNTDTIQKTKINLSAPGMIHGREMIGKADAERMVYIHGTPVIVAYDNGIYTHQSTSDTVLKQIVKTGNGTLDRDAASAYVEYVQPDGSIKTVEIDPGKITYTVNQFVPLTAGDYTVSVEVDDLSVIAQAQAPDLSFVTGEKAVKIVVADKMYSVMFEMGEHGGLEDPTESITAVAHGKKVTSPKLAPEEGYKLDYWVDEAGNRISDINGIVITENRKFTAEFKLKEFTVRFIGKRERVIKTEIVKYGFDATPPTEDKDVKNKRFNGWSADYTKITKDIDIYTTYWSKSGGGGPSGGGGFVPSGPGMNTTGNATITDADVPKNPFDNLVTIGTTHVPTGNVDMPVFTGLPKTGDISLGSKANVGYQATLIDGTKVLSEDEPLVGHQNRSIAYVFEEHTDWKKCILHIILLIVSALEGIFYFFKRRKDKRLLEELRKELEEED